MCYFKTYNMFLMSQCRISSTTGIHITYILLILFNSFHPFSNNIQQ